MKGQLVIESANFLSGTVSTRPRVQYFGHLIQGANSLEMTLMLGKIKGRRRG